MLEKISWSTFSLVPPLIWSSFIIFSVSSYVLYSFMKWRCFAAKPWLPLPLEAVQLLIKHNMVLLRIKKNNGCIIFGAEVYKRGSGLQEMELGWLLQSQHHEISCDYVFMVVLPETIFTDNPKCYKLDCSPTSAFVSSSFSPNRVRIHERNLDQEFGLYRHYYVVMRLFLFIDLFWTHSLGFSYWPRQVWILPEISLKITRCQFFSL